MLITLNVKTVNPLLHEFDVSINFISTSVGIVINVVKIHFSKNTSLGHFVNKSQYNQGKKLFVKQESLNIGDRIYCVFVSHIVNMISIMTKTSLLFIK